MRQEVGGAVAARLSYLDPRPEANVFDDMPFGERYAAVRDVARDRSAAYQAAHPGIATTAEIAGGLFSPVA